MACFERFKIGFADLPQNLPIFPLPGALLLPGGQLPLNIFEPRFVNMVLDAIQTPSRLIGLIQPVDGESMEDNTKLYDIGCAGRISSFVETQDSRILITLHGVCRFKLKTVSLAARGYRQITADWDKFSSDLDGEDKIQIDRACIMESLKDFLRRHKMQVDWKTIEAAPDYVLVNNLAMVCPFAPKEQQALLEAADLTERTKIMACLLKMSVHDKNCNEKQ